MLYVPGVRNVGAFTPLESICGRSDDLSYDEGTLQRVRYLVHPIGILDPSKD
jgi:hypothetical protein